MLTEANKKDCTDAMQQSVNQHLSHDSSVFVHIQVNGDDGNSSRAVLVEKMRTYLKERHCQFQECHKRHIKALVLKSLQSTKQETPNNSRHKEPCKLLPRRPCSSNYHHAFSIKTTSSSDYGETCSVIVLDISHLSLLAATYGGSNYLNEGGRQDLPLFVRQSQDFDLEWWDRPIWAWPWYERLLASGTILVHEMMTTRDKDAQSILKKHATKVIITNSHQNNLDASLWEGDWTFRLTPEKPLLLPPSPSFVGDLEHRSYRELEEHFYEDVASEHERLIENCADATDTNEAPNNESFPVCACDASTTNTEEQHPIQPSKCKDFQEEADIAAGEVVSQDPCSVTVVKPAQHEETTIDKDSSCSNNPTAASDPNWIQDGISHNTRPAVPSRMREFGTSNDDDGCSAKIVQGPPTWRDPSNVGGDKDDAVSEKCFAKDDKNVESTTPSAAIVNSPSTSRINRNQLESNKSSNDKETTTPSLGTEQLTRHAPNGDDKTICDQPDTTSGKSPGEVSSSPPILTNPYDRTTALTKATDTKENNEEAETPNSANLEHASDDQESYRKNSPTNATESPAASNGDFRVNDDEACVRRIVTQESSTEHGSGEVDETYYDGDEEISIHVADPNTAAGEESRDKSTALTLHPNKGHQETSDPQIMKTPCPPSTKQEPSKPVIEEPSGVDNMAAAVRDVVQIVENPYLRKKVSEVAVENSNSFGQEGRFTSATNIVSRETTPCKDDSGVIEEVHNEARSNHFALETCTEPQIDSNGVNMTILSQLPLEFRTEARLAMAVQENKKRKSYPSTADPRLRQWLAKSPPSNAVESSLSKSYHDKKKRIKRSIGDFFRGV